MLFQETKRSDWRKNNLFLILNSDTKGGDKK